MAQLEHEKLLSDKKTIFSQPSFSGLTTNWDVPDWVVNLTIGSVPTPKIKGLNYKTLSQMLSFNATYNPLRASSFHSFSKHKNRNITYHAAIYHP